MTARTTGERIVARLPPILPLALIVGVSPFATDMYIPALPAIARELHTTTGTVQLSLTAFLVAFAVGQVLAGPISDGIGRRRMLLVGTAVFALASVVCALSPDIGTFLVARVLEGLAGAMGTVAGRAMVTDVAGPTVLARVFGTLAAINAVGPVVAPLAGGALLTVGTWRLMFVVLAAFGAVLFVTVLLRFPETLPHDRRGGVGIGANLRRMESLLRIPRFRWYLVTGCLSTIGFFGYIATSSFVFQEQFGFSEGLYTIVFATNATMMIVTTLVFRRIVGRVDEDRLLVIGLLAGTIGAAGVFVGAVAGLGAAVVWPSLSLVTAGWGFVLPAAATRTQAIGRAVPGTAAALQGGLTFGLGGLGTPLAGVLGGTAVAMGVVMLGFIGLGLASQLWARHRAG
ncbi:multidrug effflux MFS transporter [Curtobacterium sp. RRHDQ10]|uniref:multidrug effflux MFS transporter n=1 Tax=Curtobacterium phyllosphaerae TaxID=3413379 RepID=UPI003BF3BFCD